MLGYPYFQSMYARASSVFGAVPSLHSAYPFIVAVEGWAAFGRAGRTFAVLFAVSMWFSAVYLDHHWVIDVVLGVAYGAAASGLVRAVRRFAPRAAPAAPVSSPSRRLTARSANERPTWIMSHDPRLGRGPSSPGP